MRLVVVTGVSGRRQVDRAARAGGPRLLRRRQPAAAAGAAVLRSAGSRPDIDRVALGIDARSGDFLTGTASIFADLRKAGHSVEVLFLDASDDILLRRFSETRRRHPLSDTDIRAGITAERQTLAGLRQEATRRRRHRHAQRARAAGR